MVVANALPGLGFRYFLWFFLEIFDSSFLELSKIKGPYSTYFLDRVCNILPWLESVLFTKPCISLILWPCFLKVLVVVLGSIIVVPGTFQGRLVNASLKCNRQYNPDSRCDRTFSTNSCSYCKKTLDSCSRSHFEKKQTVKYRTSWKLFSSTWIQNTDFKVKVQIWHNKEGFITFHSWVFV